MREHLETFLAEARQRGGGEGVPRFVERELREFLTCGVMARGFARFQCDGALYSHTGRPSIPPERLLRALLVQLLYSVRSERMLMEQLEYNLLFRWFVGLGANEPVWHPTVFTKNRDRLLEGALSKSSSPRSSSRRGQEVAFR